MAAIGSDFNTNIDILIADLKKNQRGESSNYPQIIERAKRDREIIYEILLKQKDFNDALTSSSETDPIFTSSVSAGITLGDITNWDDAYSWGDHSLAGYLTSFSETDPVFTASDASSISALDISNWNDAYSWGDHSLAGYLTSFIETDPIYLASSWFSTTNNSSDWDTAFSWGNHSLAGYLDGSDIGVSVQAYDADLTSLAGGVLTGGTTGQVLTKNSGTNYDFAWATVSGGSTGAVINYQMRLDIFYTSDPGAGKIGVFPLSPQSGVSQIVVSNTTQNGFTMTSVWSTLVNGGTIFIAHKTDPLKWVLYFASSMTIDGGCGKIPVSVIAKGNDFAHDDLVSFQVSGKGEDFWTSVGGTKLYRNSFVTINNTVEPVVPLDVFSPAIVQDIFKIRQIGLGGVIGIGDCVSHGSRFGPILYSHINSSGANEGLRIQGTMTSGVDSAGKSGVTILVGRSTSSENGLMAVTSAFTQANALKVTNYTTDLFRILYDGKVYLKSLYSINSTGIGVNTLTPNASSILDVTSTTQGFLPPRMTTVQRNAIASPAEGLMIFCTDATANDASTGVTQTYSSGSWRNHY